LKNYLDILTQDEIEAFGTWKRKKWISFFCEILKICVHWSLSYD
jgi:uncharacterized membrane protein (DUF2068 family)